MIQENELKVGNYLNYDTSEGDTIPTKIAWHDLKWLSEDSKGFNLVHSKIKITEEVLLKCGYKESKRPGFYINESIICVQVDKVCNEIIIHFQSVDEDEWFIVDIEIEYLHELQNLFSLFTRTELPIIF